jgi:hypothetical protein
MLVGVLICGAALAQQVAAPSSLKEFESYRHINTAEPQLPNRSFRRENISDDEVREIQDVAATVYPDFIVVISGVVDGCECEEGGQCTAEVALALYRENQNHSLLLSKVGDHWRLSAVQAWWLRYRAHQPSRPGVQHWEEYLAWERENQKILDSYPACPLKPEKWTFLHRQSYGSTYIDQSSLKVTGDIRRVQMKTVYPPIKEMIRLPQIQFSIHLMAFDCTDLRTRDDESTTYRNDGSASLLHVNTSVRWDRVYPDTDVAKDRELVCGWDAK